MILTAKQEEGLQIALKRYKAREAYTCIAGFAGAGKSTLISFIIDALGLDPDYDVCYIAFTGKAATVLKQKGCLNATTAHKLLYYCSPDKEGVYHYKPRKTLDGEYRLICVDEVSMLPKDMWELLLSHRIHVIALGDPGQLPPVAADQDNHVLDNPHIFLDEIMRQAQESEIIRLSMHIRSGNPLTSFNCESKEVKIISRSEVTPGMYLWADQILCATNKIRNDINITVRQMKGYEEAPAVGDKIIALKNHWDVCSNVEEWPLTNGLIGTIASYTTSLKYFPPKVYPKNRGIIYMNAIVDVDTGEEDWFEIPIDYELLKTGQSPLTDKDRYMINNKKAGPEPYEFAYGYGITTHKAQGSEWEKILLFEERFPFDEEEHRRWLYTAITRASKKLVIVHR